MTQANQKLRRQLVEGIAKQLIASHERFCFHAKAEASKPIPTAASGRSQIVVALLAARGGLPWEAAR
jgi:hypothetical protein